MAGAGAVHDFTSKEKPYRPMSLSICDRRDFGAVAAVLAGVDSSGAPKGARRIDGYQAASGYRSVAARARTRASAITSITALRTVRKRPNTAKGEAKRACDGRRIRVVMVVVSCLTSDRKCGWGERAHQRWFDRKRRSISRSPSSVNLPPERAR